MKSIVFGVALQGLQSRNQSRNGIPLLVIEGINFLETKGLDTEGLFRIPGATSTVEETREMIDAGLSTKASNKNRISP